MPSFGPALRRAREERGLSLDEVSRETRLTKRYLLALENEALDDLPGGPYNRAYVRTYATYLELDPDRLISAYAREEASQSRAGRLAVRPDVLAVMHQAAERRRARDRAGSDRTFAFARLAGLAVAAAGVLALVLWLIVPRFWTGGSASGEMSGGQPAVSVQADSAPTPPSPAAAVAGQPAPEPAVPAPSPDRARPPEPASATSDVEPAPAPVDPAARATSAPSPETAREPPSAATVPDRPAVEATPPPPQRLPEPAVVETPVARSAPAAPPAAPPAEPPDDEPAADEAAGPAAPRLAVPSSAVGADVVDRQVVGEADRFAEGSQVVFWTHVTGGRPGDTVRHVWLHEGRTAGSVDLPVGSPSWRTQSRWTLTGGSAGRWAVEARDAEGRVLARDEFVCEP